MKRGKRNEAFFQQQQQEHQSHTGRDLESLNTNRKNGSKALSYATLYKQARKTGHLNLSSKSIQILPTDIFCLDSKLESDENFWEICPLTKLDLSHNEIHEVPADISNLVDLLTLKLRGNLLENLPSTLGNCKKLRHLDVSSNALSLINHLDSTLDDLQECFLSENTLVQLPSFIFYARELKVLEVNSNRLSSISLDILNLRQLTRLCLNNNQLQDLPQGIGHLQKLQVLDVRKNHLTTTPDFSQLVNLQFLDLGENSLTRFPSLPQNGQLGRLHLDWNQLRVIDTDSISSVASTLFELHIHDNKIPILPSEIARCISLKVLDISNNDVNDLPASVGYMETLQRFLLDGNPIRAIRRSLLTQSTHDLKKYLRTRGPPLEGTQAKEEETLNTGKGKTERELIQRMRDIEGDELNLAGMNLNSLPSDWAPMVERSHSFESDETVITISRINISRNRFTHLPLDILTTNLPNLRYIDISENQLGDRRGISLSVFGEMQPSSGVLPPQLKELNLSKNMLSTTDLSALLDCFHQFAPDRNYSLTRLLLANNLLTLLPLMLLNHNQIRELQLSYNRLTNLQNLNFSYFQQLEILDLSNNKITNLGNVYEARSLRVLLLENNELENLPPELCYLTNLQTLSLHGNPQRTVRQAILQKGAGAILASLQSKLDPVEPPQRGGSSLPLTTTPLLQNSQTNSTMTVFDHRQQQQQQQRPSQSKQSADGGREEMRKLPTQEVSQARHPPPSSTSSASTSLPSEGDKILEMSNKLQEMENRYQNDFSMSESKKYALKKDMAVLRANIMRLKRNLSTS